MLRQSALHEASCLLPKETKEERYSYLSSLFDLTRGKKVWVVALYKRILL
jgi:hypothetical protein